MSFARMQEALRAEGWFVEWNMPCCQSCAWAEIPLNHEVGPFKGQEVDLEKVLFNHSQDCEIDENEEECSSCDGTGFIELEDDGERYTEDCDYCGGEGYLRGNFEVDYEPDVSVSGFACCPPTQQSDSSFCFDGDKKGVANLNLVHNLIEESGCKIQWNGRGDTRPTISWDC